jgi:hypothetical protein
MHLKNKTMADKLKVEDFELVKRDNNDMDCCTGCFFYKSCVDESDFIGELERSLSKECSSDDLVYKLKTKE